MKYFAFLSCLLLTWACSSKPSTPKYNDLKPNKISASFIKKGGKLIPIKPEKTRKTTFIDPTSGKKTIVDNWVDSRDHDRPGKRYESMTTEQLGTLLKKCTVRETTLIITELRTRDHNALRHLARLLHNKRIASFNKKSKCYWYENYGTLAEAVEIRTYAAYAMQIVLRTANIRPQAVQIIMEDKNHLLYAIKGSSAIQKSDLCRVWIEWWTKYKQDYIK